MKIPKPEMVDFLILETNSGLILVSGLGLTFSVLASIFVGIYLPGNERLFTLVSSLAVGFQGSLFTLLQVRRIDTKKPADGAAVPAAGEAAVPPRPAGDQ